MEKNIYLNSKFLNKKSKCNTIINQNINFLRKNKIQKKVKDLISIAFLGPLGSYSHLATLAYINNYFYKKTIINISCKNFSEIFLHIRNNIVNLAIVPIYNNYTGFIKEVSMLLEKNNSFLYIKKNLKFPIKHCLITYKKNISTQNIKKIFSHPQSFLQCSFFIKKYPKWIIKHCSSSSYAMNLIKKKSSYKFAAIGNEMAANLYNLNILKKNISNKTNNQTNFLILKKI
ncbi:hypothetical protein GJT89_02235 (plasmid) [Enterobacteriaceae endosymbiont of Donacia versicolorea]|uniref:prephenate dehydratase domain-containing protein n=1 Tax=Enterobacteriaceae endosymbiont of Donacia versicolorea TaxID=2675788 RepID=UPI00144A0C54|nr:prephenate dehydratase domain-containing protein [Enterobacteriaceae endosymbiont of Donacia versicolorea]QJC32296.1 hypothetical protein GJT89_02235 [Enterobacteriaceae endosymbiont of Donacia versicolorea]